MAHLNAAEKEACEVLRYFSSVGRIVKTENRSPTSHSLQSSLTNSNDDTKSDLQIQRPTPVYNTTHSLYSAIDRIDQSPQDMDDQQMAHLNAAEKEACEVLRYLSSFQGIEKQINVVKTENWSPTSHSLQFNLTNSNDVQIQWPTPVSNSTHSLFSAIDSNKQSPQQVTWEGLAIQVNQPNINTTLNSTESGHLRSPKQKKAKMYPKSNKKKQTPLIEKNGNFLDLRSEQKKTEESVTEVIERFKEACECQDESCFKGIDPVSVYKHRLNIAGLTKTEHDMYLMGIITSLANFDETILHNRHYVYEGKYVCLKAFLYLQNCTHHQLKSMTKHVVTNGVVRRVHNKTI